MAERNLRRRIWNAVDAATGIDSLRHPFDHHALAGGDELAPDHVLFRLNTDFTPTDPTCVYLDNLDGLLEFYATLRGMRRTLSIGPERDIAIRDHEVQHHYAALAMDPTARPEDAIAGVRFHEEGDLMGLHPFVVHPSLTLPKLGVAALMAYPEAGGGPSAGDLARIKNLGYSGVEDVACRVIAWNQDPPTGLSPLLVPLTYQHLASGYPSES